jgi:hypothetical protein
MAVTMKYAVFWDIVPCSSCVNRRFGGTSVHTRTTRHHNPENDILQCGFWLQEGVSHIEQSLLLSQTASMAYCQYRKLLHYSVTMDR